MILRTTQINTLEEKTCRRRSEIVPVSFYVKPNDRRQCWTPLEKLQLPPNPPLDTCPTPPHTSEVQPAKLHTDSDTDLGVVCAA